MGRCVLQARGCKWCPFQGTESCRTSRVEHASIGLGGCTTRVEHPCSQTLSPVEPYSQRRMDRRQDAAPIGRDRAGMVANVAQFTTHAAHESAAITIPSVSMVSRNFARRVALLAPFDVRSARRSSSSASSTAVRPAKFRAVCEAPASTIRAATSTKPSRARLCNGVRPSYGSTASSEARYYEDNDRGGEERGWVH
eukprot:scaffold198540_cov29-Tisochrysis_lutea.AAC.2